MKHKVWIYLEHHKKVLCLDHDDPKLTWGPVTYLVKYTIRKHKLHWKEQYELCRFGYSLKELEAAVNEHTVEAIRAREKEIEELKGKLIKLDKKGPSTIKHSGRSKM